MQKQRAQHEVRLGTLANFQTILTVRELDTLAGTIELKFETVFAGAKNPHARQTKAQFFINQSDLQSIRLALAGVSDNNQERG